MLECPKSVELAQQTSNHRYQGNNVLSRRSLLFLEPLWGLGNCSVLSVTMGFILFSSDLAKSHVSVCGQARLDGGAKFAVPLRLGPSLPQVPFINWV